MAAVSGPIRVLVVDDHEVFVQGLVRLLIAAGDIEVVGAVGSVGEAVAAATSHSPDVVLMDMELPDGDGVEATKKIKVAIPRARIVMLTGHTDDSALVRALRAGCAGFLTKTSAFEAVVAAVRAVHAAEEGTPLVDLGRTLEELRPGGRRLGASLTAREVEILQLMADGLANKRIAAELGVSLNTVRNQIQNILRKLLAHSKLEAVAVAVREGVIRSPSTGRP